MPNTLLLVEDEALIAMNEAKILEKYGFPVVTAYSAEEAVETADSDPEIALVLMDIDLGKGMDGTEAAERILRKRELPIIFLTGHAEKEYVDRVKKISNYGYVLKNSGEFVLLESINMAFNLFSAHQEQKRSEREYRELLNNIDSAVLKLNARGEVTYFSRGAEKIFGYRADEIVGKTEVGLIIPEKDSAGRDMQAMYQNLLTDPEAYSYGENENIRKDGSRIWMSWKNKAVYDERGNFLYIQAIADDITRRKRSEEALRRSEQRLKKTQQIASVGSWELDLTEDRLYWSDEIYRIFGLEPQEFPATYEAFLDAVHPEDRGAVDEAYQGSIRRNENEYSIEHRIVRPHSGEVRYVRERCEHVRDSSGRITRSIGMVQDITEQKQRETALREREANLRTTFNSIGDAVITTDVEGNIAYMNPVAEALTGCTGEEVRGHFSDQRFRLINADSGETVDDPVRKVLETGTAVGLGNHTMLVAADGNKYQIADSAAPIIDENGEMHGVVMVFRDVSEQYEKDRRLRESEERYRKLVEESPIGIFQSVSTGQFLHVNSHMASLLGAGSEEEVIEHYRDLAEQLYVRSEQRQEFLRLLERDGHVRNFEMEARRVDGQQFWVTINARMSGRRSDGSFTIDGFAADVTARKRAEEESEKQRALLASYRERLEATMKIGNIAWWEMDLESGGVIFNEQKAHMLGYRPGDFRTYRDFTDLLHPEDYERAMQSMRDCLNGSADLYNVDYRIRTKSGEYTWFHDLGGVTERDEQGNPQKVTGVVIDIDERKRVEEEHRQLVEEKDFLMKELNHRVKNNLLMISSLLSLKDSILGEDIDLSDIKSQVDAIRIVHEKLHRSEDITCIELRSYFQELLESIFGSISDRAVAIRNDIPETELDTKRAITLALIVNEMATNAVKHGFPEAAQPEFSIALTEDRQQGQYLLTLSNSGAPFPDNVDVTRAETLGLQLVGNLVRQLEGSLEVSRRAPPEFRIHFPKTG